MSLCGLIRIKVYPSLHKSIRSHDFWEH